MKASSTRVSQRLLDVNWRFVGERTLIVLPLGLMGVELQRIRPRGEPPTDLLAFARSAHLCWNGNPYSAEDLGLWSQVGSTLISPVNLNPPISLILFQPLTWLPESSLWLASNVISLLALALVFLVAPRAFEQSLPKLPLFILVVANTGIWHGVFLGQVYLPLALLVVYGVYCAHRGQGHRAALLIGLSVAIKPNLAVLPAALVCSRHLRLGIGSFGAAIAWSALPLVLFGWPVYSDWLAVQGTVGAERIGWVGNTSLWGLASRAAVPGAGPLATVMLCAWLGWWAWRIRPEMRRLWQAATAVALLGSPIAWAGYAVLLLPAWLRRDWSLSLKGAALLFLLPEWFVWINGMGDVPPWQSLILGLPYPSALLLVLWAAVRDQDRTVCHRTVR